MIHTIDIDNVRKVLSICKYYDDIINYDIAYGDFVSFDLIDFYKDYIFSSDDNDKIVFLDNCMYKYVTDYKYHKELKSIINSKEIDINSYKKTKKLLRKITIFDDNYENNKILNYQSSKWI